MPPGLGAASRSVCHSSNQKAPNPARLAPARRGRGGWGEPKSQPSHQAGETLAVHPAVPLPLARGKTLAPPDLGSSLPQAPPQLHVNIPQNPEEEGFLSGFV